VKKHKKNERRRPEVPKKKGPGVPGGAGRPEKGNQKGENFLPSRRKKPPLSKKRDATRQAPIDPAVGEKEVCGTWIRAEKKRWPNEGPQGEIRLARMPDGAGEHEKKGGDLPLRRQKRKRARGLLLDKERC